MYALDEMRGVKESSDVVRKTKAMRYPLAKYRAGERKGQFKVQSGERLRVNMTSDTFIEEADEWRDEMWECIRRRPDVIFWVLTKRPERFTDCMPEDWGDGWENVIMNITCENQEMFDKRIGYLLDLPAKHKGLCLAPFIGPIDVTEGVKTGQIEEVSVGGENYNNPRPCKLCWVQDVAFTCRRYRTNFVFYETGTTFWVGEKKLFIPSKQKQSTVAFMTGLTAQYNKPEYVLKDPDTGERLIHEKLYKRVFNANHCLLCANQAMCNGCSNCGACGNVRLISEQELLSAQNGAVIRQVFSEFIV